MLAALAMFLAFSESSHQHSHPKSSATTVATKNALCRNEWASQMPARRVTGRAQEMFIEYSHYLPEQASARVVACMRSIVGRELSSLELSGPLEASCVLAHASSIHTGAALTFIHSILPSLAYICHGPRRWATMILGSLPLGKYATSQGCLLKLLLLICSF